MSELFFPAKRISSAMRSMDAIQDREKQNHWFGSDFRPSQKKLTAIDENAPAKWKLLHFEDFIISPNQIALFRKNSYCQNYFLLRNGCYPRCVRWMQNAIEKIKIIDSVQISDPRVRSWLPSYENALAKWKLLHFEDFIINRNQIALFSKNSYHQNYFLLRNAKQMLSTMCSIEKKSLIRFRFQIPPEADCHHMKTRRQNENFFTLRISSLATTKSHYFEKIVIRTIFSCETVVIHDVFDGCKTRSRKNKSLIRFRFQIPTEADCHRWKRAGEMKTSSLWGFHH